MADARLSVHVDDPAPPKKALLPNLQRAATQLVCYSRFGGGIRTRPSPAAPREQPATTETGTVDFTRTPHWFERPPFAALAHRRGSVDVSCRDVPCVAVSELFHDPPARKRAATENESSELRFSSSLTGRSPSLTRPGTATGRA